MATAATALVTVEEFRQMEDPPGFRLELHNGEVVKVTRPKLKHWIIQTRLAELFKSAFGPGGRAGIELSFRPLPEHQLRVADVAWASFSRMKNTVDGDMLGAPEIVVEVLSPSNTASEMLAKKYLCLEAGCEEFWVVDPDRGFIEIDRTDGTSRVYKGSDRVPVGSSFYTAAELLDDRCED